MSQSSKLTESCGHRNLTSKMKFSNCFKDGRRNRGLVLLNDIEHPGVTSDKKPFLKTLTECQPAALEGMERSKYWDPVCLMASQHRLLSPKGSPQTQDSSLMPLYSLFCTFAC